MTLAVLPSAPAAVVAAFTAAGLAAGRVGTRLNSTLPAVRITRIGGTPDVEIHLDHPEVQVECWAADDVSADLLTREVLAALPGLRAVYSDGRVWSFDVTSGPYWAPDDPQLSQAARYIFTISLLTTP